MLRTFTSPAAYSIHQGKKGGRSEMKLKKAVLAAAVFGLTAASLAIAGSRTAGDAIYSTTRDGAERALSATFSLSATVVNWISDRCPDAAAPETSPSSSPGEGEA
jgi:hypothetical protein